MGELLKNRITRLPNVAGILAAVLLFLYGIAPITHYRAHQSGSCAGSTSVAAHQDHSTEFAAISAAEETDNCALCVIQATQSVLSTAINSPVFVDVPLPVYQVWVVSQSLISLFQARRGPPRAPPSLA